MSCHVIDIYTKYAWFVLLRKCIVIAEIFVRTVKNKICDFSIEKCVY